MTPITVREYFGGYRELYPLRLGPEIERQAFMTVELANKLLAQAATFGVALTRVSPRTRSLVTSGWRSPEINAATPGAAVNSRHMTGQAIDLYDPDADLDNWLMTGEGQAALVALGLWLEHPSATKGWCHLQTVPPRSQKRVFYP